MSVTQGLEQQEPGLPRFRVRLGTVLALMRVLAGRRGHSQVRWWAGGFSYDLRVRRETQTPTVRDFDADALGYAEARAALIAHLSQ